MKFDMSGGAAVLEAIGAIAAARASGARRGRDRRDREPAVRPRVKPGDIVRAMSGTTIEINNTDAEGRLVLADCLAHAIDLGAERLVDLATLTGAIVVALGSPYAGLLANDDDLGGEFVARPATRTGEPVWRLPLHDELRQADQGPLRRHRQLAAETAAAPSPRREFLHRFAGDVPWAHLDIAGVAYDNGSPTTSAKGGRLRRAPARSQLARRMGAAPCISTFRRPRAAAPHRARLRRGRGRARRGGARPHEASRTSSCAKMGDLGLMGIPFPEEYGGAGGTRCSTRSRSRS